MAGALARRHVQREVEERAQDISDGGLLERYLTGNEATAQGAFQALVERHGPMVLGICRHILNEEHDAEDAFQATFLVLARKGGSIRNRTVLAGWLHEVAHRIAIKARVSVVRRRSLERQAMAMSPVPVVMNHQDEDAAWSELRPVLHDEVKRLPEKYRLPVILCYLEGKTNEEVAGLLHWPVGTVKGRLSRARDLLRSRLVRRGLSLSAVFLLSALSQGRVFAEVVPAELVTTTVQLARKFGPRRATLGVYSGDPVSNGETRLPSRVARLSKSGPFPRLARSLPKWLVIGALVTSTAIAGVGVAATTRGGFSNLRAAVSSLLPASLSGGGAEPCHTTDRSR
jgi:RNA polymerase sigma factor (sigma-70 family)